MYLSSVRGDTVLRHGLGAGGWSCAEPPTKAERKEWLEARKRRLQERLADTDEELGKL
jgi:hypothetical protein